MDEMRSLVVWWNSSFPLDMAFRKKYNMPFNSEAHRSTNQVDVLFEFLEDSMVSEAIAKSKEKGKEKLFSDEAQSKHDDELFDKFIKKNNGKFI